MIGRWARYRGRRTGTGGVVVSFLLSFVVVVLLESQEGKRKDDWKQQPVEKQERNLDFRRELWQLLRLSERCGVYEGIRRRRT